MGAWEKRKANEHKCDYPKYSVPSDTEVGDIWRCKCNARWRVTKVTLHKVPPSRDPREHDYYTAEWELLAPSIGNGGIYAPGTK